jgi:hypothetical protein
MEAKHFMEKGDWRQNQAVGNEREETIKNIVMNIGIRSGDEKVFRRDSRKIVGEFIGVVDGFFHVVLLHNLILIGLVIL